MSASLFANFLRTRVIAFREDTTGAVSIWMIFWSLAFLTLGSIAVDTSEA
jgi:hypothetical protein